ncbi:MAG: type I DNA topoisomerase [Acidimicrobiales bacterium]
MAKPLVIVESPAKARTISRLLGSDYVVESSIGHIRDLPRGAAEVPASHKGKAWARLGVDVDEGFKPLYVITSDKKPVVAKLRKALKEASELYLATDEDREGESIAWHLLEVLSPPARMPVRRMVFHEITPAAIRRAVDTTRDVDRRLVDAQEARRILDRLYGYEVSPVLWKKVLPKLSAGRVQSVATRILVERERARMRFRAATYSGLEGTFSELDDQRDGGGAASFGAALVLLDGKRLATGRDFDETGNLDPRADVRILSRDEAVALAGQLRPERFTVRSVEEKPYRRSPYPPFMTSTLQQEAGRKLRFTTQRTMGVAQRLYENGFITYMRTDSTSLSDTAIAAARAQATELYGADYVPTEPRRYAKKVKNAQEAHEAIRPAGDSFRTPDQVAGQLKGDERALYELIWKRTVASQMADVRGASMQVRLGNTPSATSGQARAAEDAEFSAGGKVIDFPGFLRAYVEGSDDPEAELEDREVRLPPLAPGDVLNVEDLEAKDHSTSPPARYTEASLVKAMEELGVGRPSTYASIIGTVQDRGYVWKRGTALIPSFTAFAVVALLERHFSDLVDYAFTARMEDDLDSIARGQAESEPWLSKFYFGNGTEGLRTMVGDRLEAIDAREVNSIPLGKDSEGRPIAVRVGRYGPYLSREPDTAAVPEGIAPDELTIEKAEELLASPSGDRPLGTDPSTGLCVLARVGRFGPYVQLGEDPASDQKGAAKPPTASLFKTMALDSVTLDDALRLLSLPRVLGADPVGGEEVVALNGRYGPYVKKGTDSRSLDDEERLFTVTLTEALAMLAEPKQRGRRAAPEPLRELGPDPVSGGPITVKEGRFGPYVTDGTTNASLRTGDDVASITPERAAELLQDRRDRGPAKPRAAAKRRPAAGKRRSA